MIVLKCVSGKACCFGPYYIFGLLSFTASFFCFREVSMAEIIPPSAFVDAERAVGTPMMISEIKRMQYVEHICQNRAAKSLLSDDK